MKKKILLESPILTQSGYGEHARFVLRSLKLHEDIFDIFVIPVNWGKCSWLFEDNEERRWIDSLINKTMQYLQQNPQPQFDIYLHCGIANEMKKKAPISIHITAGIEANKCAPEWIDILNNQADKIITVSQHSKDVFENTTWDAQDQFNRQFKLKLNIPVEVVGYPIKTFNHFTDEKLKETFQFDYNFNFLTVAQWGPRKNLEQTIRLFIEEFKNEKVGLVCKINLADNSLIDKNTCEKALKEILKSYPNTVCKIYLLHGDMSEDEIHNLYIHPQVKAIINFGHGEGFGLPLFEAAYCGLPVIIHDYSGHRDFLYMDIDGKKKAMFTRVPYDMNKIQPEAVWNGVLHPESEWAFIKPFGAKLAMREVYKDYGRFKGQARKLKDYLVGEDLKVNKYEKMANIIIGKYFIEPKDFDGISFCIPTNGKRVDKTKILLNSIRKQVGKPFEIIMCGDIENFKDEKDVILVEQTQSAHSGKVALLRNKAAEKSKYDVIAWCDDDIILENNWLENTISYSKNNGWDVLGNRVFNPDGTRYWDRSQLNPHSLVDYEEPGGNLNLYQSSAFFISRKLAWEHVKWDETKLVHADKQNGISEDIQYSIDLKHKNYKFCFNVDSLVWHNDDSYTEFNFGNISCTLKKDVLKKDFGMNFFLPLDDEFKKILPNE